MSNARIKYTDTTRDIVIKMSDGNPGAMTALMEMLESSNIDPDGAMGGLVPILSLDTHGIYGTDIYVLHSDICGREMPKTLAVLRACQLGFFSGTVLRDACSRQDYSGRDMVPVEELYKKVKESLPNFDVADMSVANI